MLMKSYDFCDFKWHEWFNYRKCNLVTEYFAGIMRSIRT
jgi:hypothetical protein